MKFKQLLSTLSLAQDFDKPLKVALNIEEINPIDDETHPLCWAMDIKEFNRPEFKELELDDKEVLKCWLLECSSDTMYYNVYISKIKVGQL